MNVRKCDVVAGCLVAAALLLGGSCGRREDRPPVAPRDRAGSAAEKKREAVMGIALSSPAFEDGSPIPARYTCQGDDISPPLKWGDVPEGTKSLAVIFDDPDAPMGTWVHWVIYGLPPETRELKEGVPPKETLPDGSRQGTNDFKRIGYGGPCPPPGKPHRYFFKLYALDSEIDLEPGATKKQLLSAMQGHVIGEGRLMGTYQRR